MRSRFLRCAMLSATMAFGFSATGRAQDVEAGHRLAVKWCTSCHEVEKTVRGPLKDNVPSFLSIARMPSATQMSLTVFLATPHPSMPNFSLTRREISDVVAYILSLGENDSQTTNAAIRSTR